ncbi:uncharacterized protein K441DRAFT_142404 [Cenococcum geophilum 1.58]|uniref:uncharacterized protein n=1 Tax=Cenococcum geophilum 1.58 TaxID=794803 RepID=UPI0035902F9B|nr:hypothetical protein K441DRAFT_142404 [Cenococcum geophilum 1.58]
MHRRNPVTSSAVCWGTIHTVQPASCRDTRGIAERGLRGPPSNAPTARPGLSTTLPRAVDQHDVQVSTLKPSMSAEASADYRSTFPGVTDSCDARESDS